MQPIESTDFLAKVAKDIAAIDNKDILSLRIVFTNRRAIRYFSKEYADLQQGTYWMPRCCTINDFVQSLSPYRVAKELSLIYALYVSYCKIYYQRNPLAEGEQQESFEQFYFWGKILLSDFDDLDKNLADAKKLYTVLQEEKEMEDLFDFLSENQKETLAKYFENFRKLYSTDSKLKHNFVRVWNCLFDVYTDFRKSLSELGIAYGGMMYRDLLDRILKGEVNFGEDRFAFVGFNVLNSVEKELFRQIRSANEAAFYWDYDTYYTEDAFKEAGLFMRENISDFPCSEAFSRNDFSRIANNEADIQILSCSYETSQVFYIKQWIRHLEETFGKTLKQNRIAIILQNENLLPFVLKSLPEEISGEPTRVNITMGNPFRFSSLCDEVSKLAQQIANEGETIAEQIDALADFVKQKGESEGCDDETKQAAYETLLLLEDFKQMICDIPIPLSENFVYRSLMRMLQSQTMPFESDATEGMQIMGLLESRNLDFDHVLMLSCNATNLPRIGNLVSFIPHSLREVFCLTTSEKKVAVFAYYFYRLLHNAKTIHYIYNTVSSNKDGEEMSCFLQQLRVELARPIDCKHLSFPSTRTQKPINLPAKTEDELQNLISRKSDSENPKSFLSPSFLASYIDCPLQFYFKQICRLSVPEEPEDRVNLVFGTLFHASAQKMEEDKAEKPLTEYVDEAFGELDKVDSKLIKQVHRDLIAGYLEGLRDYDNKHREEHFEEAEKQIVVEKQVAGRTLRFGGIIDRIDREGATLILSDYKTGGNDEEYRFVGDLFYRDGKARAKYLFQIMFYAWLLWQGEPIRVRILYAHKLKNPSYKPTVYEYDSETHKDFDEMMNKLITSLLNNYKPPVWESNPKDMVCNYCDYTDLCPQGKEE